MARNSKPQLPFGPFEACEALPQDFWYGDESFRLRKVTFRGEGLQPQVRNASWNEIRDLVYEDRGA